MADIPGPAFDFSSLDPIDAKNFINIDIGYFFQVKIFNVCSKPEKLVKTEDYTFKMKGKITQTTGKWHLGIKWDSNAPACEGGIKLEDTFGALPWQDVPL